MRILAAALFLGAAVPAAAVDLGLRLTTGNEGYAGTSAYAGLPVGDFTLRPSLDTAKSDAAVGTFKNLALRLGYDTSVFGLGAYAGISPKTEGYQNASAGGDLTVTVSATGGGSKRIRTSGGGAPRGKGLARVDLGAGFGVIQHEDERDAAGATRASARKLTQQDVRLFAGASVIGFFVSGNITRSTYDKDLLATDRPAPRLAIDGIDTRLAGFPETSLTLHGEVPFLPLINPFVTINTTSYEASGLTSKTVALGAYVGLEMIELYGALERTTFSGIAADDLTTATLGASLRFGLGG